MVLSGVTLPGALFGDLQSLVLPTAPRLQVGLSNITFEVLALMCLLPLEGQCPRKELCLPIRYYIAGTNAEPPHRDTIYM